MTNTLHDAWREPGYSDIVAARRADSWIEVEFANGDIVRASPDALGVHAADFAVEVVPDEPLSIQVIDRDGGRVEVSWTLIRGATDQGFAQTLWQHDLEESKMVGLRLRALREDRGLSKQELAKRVGTTPTQLSKGESGSVDLRISTVQSLLRAMDASLADIAGADAPIVSLRELRKHAQGAGVPNDVIDRLLSGVARRAVPEILARAFRWTRDALLDGVPVNQPPPAEVRFKLIHPGAPRESALINLAYLVSQAIRQAASGPSYNGIDSDPARIRSLAADDAGKVTLDSLVGWMWNAGIPVIPLFGRGGFAGTAWVVDGDPVVVLKDMRNFASLWLFDLAHELGHLARGHLARGGIIDVDAPQVQPEEDQEEQDASAFALQLLLPEYQALLSQVRVEARGSHLRFKNAVATVAQRADVRVGLLGMVAAYALTEVGEYKDRWGSATNLARPEGSGRGPVQRALWEHLDPGRLPAVDRAIVQAVIGEPEA